MIEQEQPPAGTDPELSAWLMRFVFSVYYAIEAMEDRIVKLESTNGTNNNPNP